ncbi:molybdopterin-dependent oxidoreductase, partial [Rhodococcus hoagii]|nr:molybdopterin-dependent oxidoreductase [Prescottella equi]
MTSVPAGSVLRIAREFARSAERSGGRSMIIMGAGICQWFHGDATYRAVLALLMADRQHGQERRRLGALRGPGEGAADHGWATMAMAPMVPAAATGHRHRFWYMHADQWRYDGYRAARRLPARGGKSRRTHTATPSRSPHGWAGCRRIRNSTATPSTLADDAAGSGVDVGEYVVDQLRSGNCTSRSKMFDAEENWPRVLTLWRANLLGGCRRKATSTSRNLLGAGSSLRADE